MGGTTWFMVTIVMTLVGLVLGWWWGTRGKKLIEHELVELKQKLKDRL